MNESAPQRTESARPAGAGREVRFPVWFVNQSSAWGGGEQWHLATAHAMAQRGWPVLLVVRPGSALHERVTQAGLECWPLVLGGASWLNPFKIAQVLRRLKADRPGAVLLNGGRELKSMGALARCAGVPRIVFRRGIPQPLPDKLGRYCLRSIATRLVCNSQATLDAVGAPYPDRLAGLRPRVIYNGVDPAGFEPPRVRVTTGRIVMVGRLEWEKGADLLLNAFEIVRRHVPHARLRIVGDGTEREALEELAAALDVRESVEFAGATRRVAESLRDCDVFVLPSRWEGFGFVLVEAMLMELPTVAFDVAAAREIVADNVTGLLAPAEDTEALAAALVALLKSPARARDLGKAGRLRAISTFTMDRAVSELEHLLLEP